MCSPTYDDSTAPPTDLVDRLRLLLELTSADWIKIEDAKPLLRETVAEIERLRGVAGAVTPGASGADIKRAVGKVPAGMD